MGLLQARDGNSEAYGHELRERVRRTDLGFAAPFLPVGVIDSLGGTLELALASAVCFTVVLVVIHRDTKPYTWCAT